jgi:hypothetical protein
VPFKTFTASVLSSADVNTYLMKQAVITCTSGTRPASPVQGMMIYETDTNKLATYSGAAWSYLGGYTAYTPTTTNLTVGNGTLQGRYTRIGDQVDLSIKFTVGTTSAFLAGQLGFSLPAPSRDALTISAALLDISAGTWTPGRIVQNAATSTISVAYETGTTLGAVSTTAPFTWAAGDIVLVQGTYEAA